MGKWTEQYGSSVAVAGTWTRPEVADAHNADCEAYEARIAALEAERDELRRKLDALKPKPPECAIDEPGGDEDDWIAWDEAMANYRLIVEGRDNG